MIPVKFKQAWDNWQKNPVVTQRSVPEEVKWAIITSYPNKFLVETGTAVADTILHVHEFFDEIHSFELMETYFDVAKRNTAGLKNVFLHNSSSADEQFAFIVSTLDAPATFYLDAHYSGEGTGKDLNLETPDVPVRQELKTILASPFDNVIIIDDARCFSGESEWSSDYVGYPTAEEIQDIVGDRYILQRVADSFVLTNKEQMWTA